MRIFRRRPAATPSKQEALAAAREATARLRRSRARARRHQARKQANPVEHMTQNQWLGGGS